MENKKTETVPIQYKGQTMNVLLTKVEDLSNGWEDYNVKCEEETFKEVFDKNEIHIVIKPSLRYSPENDSDYDGRTPDQTILVQEIWDYVYDLENGE